MKKQLSSLMLLAAIALQTPLAKAEVAKTDPVSSTSSVSIGHKIDLNLATLAELQTLPGVGISKAKAIISYREQVGPFLEVAQLTEVKGIGNKMLAKINDLVVVK